MQLHEIEKIYKTKNKKRVGRGGKRGTFSGHGMKGQRSRAGKNIRPAVRDYIIHLPKLRGLKFNSIKDKPAVVNLAVLEKNFKSGETVSPKILLEKKLVRRIKGKVPAVKILGFGSLKSKLVFKNCLFSASAREKIGLKAENKKRK